jgi:hypothetical protein
MYDLRDYAKNFRLELTVRVLTVPVVTVSVLARHRWESSFSSFPASFHISLKLVHTGSKINLFDFLQYQNLVYFVTSRPLSSTGKPRMVRYREGPTLRIGPPHLPSDRLHCFDFTLVVNFNELGEFSGHFFRKVRLLWGC